MMVIVGPMPDAARTILVVDDELEVLLLACDQLGALGYTVLKANNGRDGLRLLEERPDIGLLFTDVMMPGGMNGFELAHRAVEKRPGLRVLYTSGFTGGMPNDNWVRHGPLLPKPWRLRSLITVLDQAFG
jgi:CheY-like chemotaxis protein